MEAFIIKKFLTLLLAIVMVCSLVACGKQNDHPSSSNTQGSQQQEEIQPPSNASQKVEAWSVISNFHNEATSLALSEEDAKVLEELLSAENWVNDVSACDSDVSLTCSDGRSFAYHSSCGTFNGISNEQSLELDEVQKGHFNELLRKYIELVG